MPASTQRAVGFRLLQRPGLGSGNALPRQQDQPRRPARDAEQRRPRPIDPGTFSGFDFPEGRTFLLDITVISPDNATYHTDLAALQAAFSPLKSAVLPLYIFGSQRVIYCRVRKRAAPYDASWPQRTGVVSFEMFALTTGVRRQRQHHDDRAGQSGGAARQFPYMYPYTYGAATSGGSLTFTNLGNFATRPVFTISGTDHQPVHPEHDDRAGALPGRSRWQSGTR